MHLPSILLLSTLFSLSLAVPTPAGRDASHLTRASSAQASVPPGLLSWMHQTTPAGVNMFFAEQRLTGNYIFKAFNSESPIHLKAISGDNGLFYVGAPGANTSSEVISIDSQGAAKFVRTYPPPQKNCLETHAFGRGLLSDEERLFKRAHNPSTLILFLRLLIFRRLPPPPPDRPPSRPYP
ncbi:MAG: hypothetical protein Q9167_007311, partial [Letrouitia subvulpina]